MSKEIIVTESREIRQDLNVTNQDIDGLTRHIDTIKTFVNSQLREDINGDYAIIPGCPKKSLLKPGAEKLLKLFGLGSKVELVDKEIDRYENFASYTYRAIIYHLKTGIEIAQCEGVANSWEKKYKTNRSGAAIPVCDILNTLMKMAQKRAIVGATILATCASDYFTQDEDEIETQREARKPKEVDATKFTAGEQKDVSGYVVPIGKFKGKKLSEIPTKELVGYCTWVKENNKEVDGKLKEFIDTAREYIRTVQED